MATPILAEDETIGSGAGDFDQAEGDPVVGGLDGVDQAGIAAGKGEGEPVAGE